MTWQTDVFPPMYLPCGGTAYFDHESGISYRCTDCMAVVGSIGQPQECKDEANKYDAWAKLGGVNWDYNAGREKDPHDRKKKPA